MSVAVATPQMNALPTSSRRSSPTLPPLPTKNLSRFDSSELTPGRHTGRTITPRSGRSHHGSDDSNLEFELEDLRNEIRSKDTEISTLTREVQTLKRTIDTKDDALGDMHERLNEANEQILNLQTEMASLTRELNKIKETNEMLLASSSTAQSEADRLNKLMLCHSDSTARSLNEASQDIARLKSQLTRANKDIEKLSEDNKGCYAQIKAKDKVIDRQAQRVKEAEEILASQKEEQNKISQLRRQLAEAQHIMKDAGLLQEISGKEATSLANGQRKMANELETTKRYLARVKADLEDAQRQLTQSQAQIGDLEGELDRAKAANERARSAQIRKSAASPLVATFLDDELNRSNYEVKRVTSQINAMNDQLNEAREDRDRLYSKLDKLIVEFQNAADEELAAQYEGLLDDLRLELLTLRHRLDIKEADCVALEHACEASGAACALERVKALALRYRLGEAMEVEDYESEFGTAPPTAKQVHEMEREAKEWSSMAAHAAKSWNKSSQRVKEVAAEIKTVKKYIIKKQVKLAKTVSTDSSSMAGSVVDVTATTVLDTQDVNNNGVVEQVVKPAETVDTISFMPEEDDVTQNIYSSADVDDDAYAMSADHQRAQLEQGFANVQRMLDEQTHKLTDTPTSNSSKPNADAVTTARTLEELNEMSLMVGSLKQRYHVREEMADRREQELMREVAMLRAAISGGATASPNKNRFGMALSKVWRSGKHRVSEDL